MKVSEDMRINFVIQMVLGSILGNMQTRSTFSIPPATSKEMTLHRHETVVSWGNPLSLPALLWLHTVQGQPSRDCDMSQDLTNYPPQEERVTSWYCSFLTSVVHQAKMECTLQYSRVQDASLLMTVVSAQETGLLGRTHVCHETRYSVAG